MPNCIDCSCELLNASGNTKRCAPCRLAHKRASGKAWYAANREAVCERMRASVTPERRAENAARAREWRAANPDKHLKNQRKYKRKQYGVTNPTDETKFGMCYIAGCEYVGPLQFDHYHTGPKKGQFRGWLCRACNLRLGHAVTASMLRASAEYLDLADGVGWPLDTDQPAG